MKRIFYLIQKEFRQIRRDKAMLAIIFVVPLIQTIVLGFAMTVDVKNIRLIVYDADRSAISRELYRRFEANPYFDMVGYAESPEQIRASLDQWEAQISLFVPLHFGRDLELGRQPVLHVTVDGLDGNTAGIAMGYARGVATDFALEFAPRRQLAGAGIVLTEPRFWYNLNLTSKNYMVPGLIAILLTVVTMFLTSMGLVREKEIGTLEQLMVTPISAGQLIIGKVLPFLLIGLIELHIILPVAFVVFGLQFAGSYPLLVGSALLYFLTTLGLGIFISTLADTQQQAMFIAWFFMVFMILMSGFFTPIENMPPFWQQVTYLNPARYFIALIREIFLKATPLYLLWNQLIPLAIIGVVIISASVLKFNKRAA